jgi:thymidylate synthase
MLYTNVNTAYYEILKKLINAVDGREPGFHEISRTGDKCTYVLPQSFEMTVDTEFSFPLIETRHVPTKACFVETLWYLTGQSNIQMLKDHNVKIWNEWATEEGELGPVYGVQWRNFNGQGIDQIKQMFDTAVNSPNSRQNIVTAWNPSVLPDPKQTAQQNVQNGKQALPPCHTLFKIRVHPGKDPSKKYLSMHLYAR